MTVSTSAPPLRGAFGVAVDAWHRPVGAAEIGAGARIIREREEGNASAIAANATTNFMERWNLLPRTAARARSFD